MSSIFDKRWLAAACGLVAAGATVLYAQPRWLVRAVARLAPGCLYQVATRDRLVALTIDDGPDPATTPEILAELRRHGAHATFFLISERVRRQPEVMEKLVADGHEVGNHFTRDRPSIGLSPAGFEADLLEADRELSVWASPTWARPGSGWYTPAMVRTMRRHGYRCALGSVYPYDAAIPSVSWGASFILRNIHPGAIVVLHDGGARGHRTSAVLARVLPELRRLGYRVVSLSELVAAT
jgi:peptidoglycan-N-acetylglucosamine deacetylase